MSSWPKCWLGMPPGSLFIAIQPPTRFNAQGKMRANAVGINWAYLIAILCGKPIRGAYCRVYIGSLDC
jgi:hypothetical protein